MSGSVNPPSQIASLLLCAGVGRMTWCKQGGTLHVQVPVNDVMIGQRDVRNDHVYVPSHAVPEVWAPVEVLEVPPSPGATPAKGLVIKEDK